MRNRPIEAVRAEYRTPTQVLQRLYDAVRSMWRIVDIDSEYDFATLDEAAAEAEKVLYPEGTDGRPLGVLTPYGNYVLEGNNETHSICYGPDAEEDAVEVAEAVNERRARRAGMMSIEQVATAWGTFDLAEPAPDADAELEKLRRINEGLIARVAAQSELLANRAMKTDKPTID